MTCKSSCSCSNCMKLKLNKFPKLIEGGVGAIGADGPQGFLGGDGPIGPDGVQGPQGINGPSSSVPIYYETASVQAHEFVGTISLISGNGIVYEWDSNYTTGSYPGTTGDQLANNNQDSLFTTIFAPPGKHSNFHTQSNTMIYMYFKVNGWMAIPSTEYTDYRELMSSVVLDTGNGLTNYVPYGCCGVTEYTDLANIGENLSGISGAVVHFSYSAIIHTSVFDYGFMYITAYRTGGNAVTIIGHKFQIQVEEL